MVIEREYGGEISEEEDTESLTSEQISRMSPTEIEDFRNKRARDFARSLGVPLTQAQRMADSEIDSMIEGAKFEKGSKELQESREKAWEERGKEYQSIKDVSTTDEDVTTKIQEVEDKEKPLEKIIEKVPSKDAVPKESIFEKMFGKRKPDVPKTEKEIRMERIQKSKEEHLAKIMKLRSRPVIGKMREQGREPSFRDIGKGSMGAKEYGRRDDVKDFFGMNKYVMGTRSPKIGEKTTRIGLPSTKLRPVGTRPPSTSFGGGTMDIASIVNVGFGSRKSPSVAIRPATLKDKLEKPKIVKPAEFSLGFSNTIPDINASLSLGKSGAKKQISTPSKVKPAFVIQKNPVGDWGISNKVKNPIDDDWGFTKKPAESNKKEKLNNKKPKKESLDFLNIGKF